MDRLLWRQINHVLYFQVSALFSSLQIIFKLDSCFWIPDETTTPTSTTYSTPTEDKYPEILVTSTKSNIFNDSKFLQASIYTPSEAPTTPPTILPVSPTIMTIKVKAKNSTTTTRVTSSTAPRPSFQPSTKYTSYASPTFTTLPPPISTTSQSTATITTQPSSEKPAEADYDNGFSLENMLSFLFDEPPTPTKNVTNTSAKTTTFSTSARSPPSTAEYKANTLLALLSSRISTTAEPTTSTTIKLSSTTTDLGEPPSSSTAKALKSETDSAIYMIKNENAQSKTILNYTELQDNNIEPINSYFVPPLGNFEEVILNPTKKPFTSVKKPPKSGNPSYHSTTYRPRHTTAKVIPLGKPHTEKNIPQVIAADPGAASGVLKLSGCNIFGKMYRLGQSIFEISTPCLQCMCAEIGVHCTPLKC